MIWRDESRGVVVRVPAKINLQLSVGPLGHDGFHDLVTVFQAVSLFDEVTVKTIDRPRANSGDSQAQDFPIDISVRGTFTNGVPLDESNLAVKAARLFFQTFKDEIPASLSIEIKKEIPIAGGLAGGSADAAGVLLALDSLYKVGASKKDLEILGSQLGSDVPFSLSGGVSIGRGRGDQLTPVLTRGNYYWVIAVAHQGLSTPVVYGECDRLREGLTISAPTLNQNLVSALAAGDSRLLGQALSNDLQTAAISLKPALKLILEVGKEHGALGGLVSGSGPTIVFLAQDEESAMELSVALAASGVVAGVVHATGPVAGAQVIKNL
jgi:4-diphosphocytidyl-2-C-methyl-D-erythritol kinase